ncbi:MAG TPA: acetylglutamate kinase [Acidimicrobiales bacterium]|nr:acetylglutamate kinase [Acidimicrobiales bacterium]
MSSPDLAAEPAHPTEPREPAQAPTTPPTSGLGAAAKAGILVEALPYIRRFWGKVVVVKYGGNALGAASSQRSALSDFATDIVLMRSVGMLPVVVHGGGPQIGELMGRLGKTPEFRDGLRVTDSETLEIARMVLVGKVNRDIVSAINVHGPLAVGVSGEDAGLIQASLRDAALGFVGDISHVAPELLTRLLAANLVPVVATIGTDETGQAYNINADTTAGAVAVALEAEKLVFLTDVEGLRANPADPAALMSQLSADQLDELVRAGAVAGGMVPKAEAAISAVRAGVAQAHILDGRAPHALLLEFFTRSGVGTMVLP